jgi:hypothetical protein
MIFCHLLHKYKGFHKVFNKSPKLIADLILDKKRFIVSLEKYLSKKSFYSVEEFLNDNAYA